MSKIQFNIESPKLLKQLFVVLVSCELFIFFMDILLNHYKLVRIGAIRRLFNITREDGISNFFSSFQLIAVGLALFMVYAVSKKIYENQSWIQEKGWLILALFFTFMGFDDATKFHERMGTFAKKIAGAGGRSVEDLGSSIFDIFPSYAWQIVFGPFFFIMGLFILWYLLKNFKDNTTKLCFIGGLSLYVIAVGLDFIEGMGEVPYQGVADAIGITARQARHLSKAYEETFEMFGTTLFLMAFLRHLFFLTGLGNPLELFFRNKSSV